MEKDQKILLGLIVFILLITIGIGTYLFVNKDKSSDAIKFKNEYELLNNQIIEKQKEKYLNVDIPDDNIFVYKSDEEIINIIKDETGLIYFGMAKCPFCRSMVALLNEVAASQGLKKIYYVDISNIRDSYEVIDGTIAKIINGTPSYYKLLDLLNEYLTDYYVKDTNDVSYNTGIKRLYAPTVVAFKNGEVIDFYEGTLEDAKYNKELNDEQEKLLKKTYTNIIKQIH